MKRRAGDRILPVPCTPAIPKHQVYPKETRLTLRSDPGFCPVRRTVTRCLTPGTRLAWADLDGWIEAARALDRRRAGARSPPTSPPCPSV